MDRIRRAREGETWNEEKESQVGIDPAGAVPRDATHGVNGPVCRAKEGGERASRRRNLGGHRPRRCSAARRDARGEWAGLPSRRRRRTGIEEEESQVGIDPAGAVPRDATRGVNGPVLPSRRRRRTGIEEEESQVGIDPAGAVPRDARGEWTGFAEPENEENRHR